MQYHKLTNISLALTAAASLATACKSPAGGREPQPGSPTLHTFTSGESGFHTSSYWLDTGAEVVVFDAQFTPSLAEELIASIRRETDHPIRYVVVTHPNPDKFNGATEFQALGAEVVASNATAEALPNAHAYKKNFFVNVAGMFTEETYPAEPRIDVTFSGDYTLELEGDAVVELRELENPGVSSTQTVAFLRDQNALIVGDLVHNQVHAWLEGGVVGTSVQPDLEAWKRALAELEAYGDATVYGGRGGMAKVPEAVQAQTSYLEQIETLVADYLRDNNVTREILSSAEAGNHYKAIANLAAQAFPNYDHSYLIEYGVYGLATSLAP